MAKEIERKFIVGPGWEADVDAPGTDFIQAYLSTDPRATVRVRIAGNSARLTIKGRNEGISRDEWEYEIPLEDARQMIARCAEATIEKTRYRAGRWEIDVFHGRLNGLILAEIELTSADEAVTLPGWIVREVSDDPAYFNSSLAKAMPE